MARRSELSSFGASTGRSSRRYGPRTRAPSARGLVSGLRPWNLSSGRHPSYAASIFYRLEIFTLWIHGYLQASHNATERDIRAHARHRAMTGGTRSTNGSKTYAHWMSITQTRRKNTLPLRGYVTGLYESHLHGKPPPSVFTN